MDGSDDREPVLRLGVANRVTAGEDRTGRAHALVRAGKHLAEHLDRKLLRERGDGQRQQRRPPIAKTSFSAFVAAIAPNVRGSSTSGGKKSTVKTIARSSSSR